MYSAKYGEHEKHEKTTKQIHFGAREPFPNKLNDMNAVLKGVRNTKKSERLDEERFSQLHHVTSAQRGTLFVGENYIVGVIVTARAAEHAIETSIIAVVASMTMLECCREPSPSAIPLPISTAAVLRNRAIYERFFMRLIFKPFPSSVVQLFSTGFR